MEIVCISCHNHWRVDVPDSVYLQLDVSSQPCPACEAYTLTHQLNSLPKPVPQSWQSWQKIRSEALTAKKVA
jgi:hypothetical protein